MQLVQYINLVRSDDTAEGRAFGDSFVSSGGVRFPWIDADEYETDDPAGHGTHTAGSAAGATISSPANTTSCPSDRVLSCVGGCISENAVFGDDLVSSFSQLLAQADLDRLCPEYDCDGWDEEVCLSGDAATTLTEHGGVARGAKISIFDVFTNSFTFGTYLAGNGMWEAPMEIGGKLHSNSWGGDLGCRVDAYDILYDEFMYEVSDKVSPPVCGGFHVWHI